MEDVLTDSRAGEVLDERYRIIEPIAAGGMGTVWRAERLGLGRFVAVKFLTDVDSEQSLKRFDREARAMSRLNHPHVVSVIDFGVARTPYIVMEYVTGRPLHELIALGPTDASRAIHIMRQLSAGLAHAHGQGIIHRDIKPANVMLTEATGTGDYVRILDFGLAKLKGTASLSASNIVVGTPSYMAPEQSRGEEEDGRSDIYSSGVLLFELLKGEKPFKSDDALQTLRMHQNDPVPPLDELRGASPELARQIEGVVHRALAKEPEERFQTALDFGDALAELAEAAKAEAQPAGKPGRRRKKKKTDVGRAKTIPVDTAEVAAAYDESDSNANAVDVDLEPTREPAPAFEVEPDNPRTDETTLDASRADTVLASNPPAAVRPGRDKDSRAGGLFALLILVGAAAAGYWWWDKRNRQQNADNTAKPVERVAASGQPAPPTPDAAMAAIAATPDSGPYADDAAAPLADADAAPEIDAGAILAVTDAAPEIGDAGAADDPDEEPESTSADAPPDAGATPAPAARPPRPTEIRRWADVKALIDRGEKGAAVIGLRKLIRKFPRNAFYKLRLGHLYFERTAWTLGLKQYQAALKLKPAYKRYNTVNTNAIRALGAPSTYRRARYLITRVIGRRAAMPYLRREARRNKSGLVRKRCAQLIKRFR